jgi:hypothetical protein
VCVHGWDSACVGCVCADVRVCRRERVCICTEGRVSHYVFVTDVLTRLLQHSL